MLDLGLASASSLRKSLNDKLISSRELLQIYLDRIERLNPQINAVVSMAIEEAVASAQQADDATARGESLRPLHGLPMTIKDAIETKGIRSTGGAMELRAHVPQADAPAVAAIRSAGAIVFGKTNLPPWSMDIQSFNKVFGTTNNPWDLSRTPGGSSGGAAAAVAAGMTSIELGTDIGGSIRMPASFCGVFGHKPSYGLVSQRGCLDRVGGGARDLDINVFGPLARSIEDLELLLEVVAGNRLDRRVANDEMRLDELRVGVWVEDPFYAVDAEVSDVLHNAVDAFAKAGAKVTTARPPLDLKEMHGLFMALAGAALWNEGQAGPGISHQNWLELDQARQNVRDIWSAWFAEHDVLLCPVMPTVAFAHDQRGNITERTVSINAQAVHHLDMTAWVGLVGVAYLPASVIPLGPAKSGLPVGAQIVGPFMGDRMTMRAARLLSSIVGGFTAPPLAQL